MHQISALFHQDILTLLDNINIFNIAKSAKFLANIEINSCYFKKITSSLVIFFEDLVYFLIFLKFSKKNPISKKDLNYIITRSFVNLQKIVCLNCQDLPKDF